MLKQTLHHHLAGYSLITHQTHPNLAPSTTKHSLHLKKGLGGQHQVFAVKTTKLQCLFCWESKHLNPQKHLPQRQWVGWGLVRFSRRLMVLKVCNYCPFWVSQIYWKCWFDRYTAYLESRPLTTTWWVGYGFRNKYSTKLARIDIVNDWAIVQIFPQPLIKF